MIPSSAPSSAADKQKSLKMEKSHKMPVIIFYLLGKGVEDIWEEVPILPSSREGGRKVTHTLGKYESGLRSIP